jgi:CBS domain containing-hemolysin-like protein
MVMAAGVLLVLLPSPASASFLSPEMEDVVADWLTVFVLILVPVVGIALFWMVHILPEQIAHKRHHPQLEAIRTLCLLSLVFGGLLWPIAWIWAYTKPVMHQMAYGTDKHDDYLAEQAALKSAAVAPAVPASAPAAGGAEKH